MGYEKELAVAVDAAKKAGVYLQQTQKQASVVQTKGEGTKNYATVQDLESDQIITETILAAFPDDFVLSEENVTELGNHERVWVIDPIDGTRNFANGLSYYSVCVAFRDKGQTEVGVVYAPDHNGGELYSAMRGEGALLNGDSLKMMQAEKDMEHSIVVTGFAYFKGEELKQAMSAYEEVLNRATDVMRFGSAALDICQVATGRLGAYYESGLKPWDVAAGLLILSEMGGVVSDYQGGDLDIFRRQTDKYAVNIVVGKNEKISKELIEIIG